MRRLIKQCVWWGGCMVFLAGAALGQSLADTVSALRIRAVGDVMMGTDFPSVDYLPPHDGATYFDGVAHLLQDADLTFVNLEGPFIDGGTTDKCSEGSNCYAFRTPTHYGTYLQAIGVDLASVANNHARDFGPDGMASTTAMLDSLGISWSGPAGTIATVYHGSWRVGMVAFHTARHSNYLNDLDTAAQLVQKASATHDIVVVSFHGGAEGASALRVPEVREFFYGEDRGDLRRFARHMIDAGADLILGHGPHVPRGMEIYRGRLIAYSLGNFATYGRFNLRGALGVGVVLETTLNKKGRFMQGRLFATRQVGEGIPIPDTTQTAINLIRTLSIQDFPDSFVQLTRRGVLLDRTFINPLPWRPLGTLAMKTSDPQVLRPPQPTSRP